MDAQLLADEHDALRAENEELKKLLAQYGLFREIVGDPATEFASLRREFHSLERENIKLRELCSDMMGWIAFTTMGESVPEERYCELEDRMCELGIEANS